MDFFNDFMNDLPQQPLLGPPHRIPPVIDEIIDLLNDLPQIPLLGPPHHIRPVNDEEDEPLMNRLDADLQIEDDADVLIHAHDQPLPVYGPNHILLVDLIPTRLPDHWPVYRDMNYFGLEEENQDEDQNREEEDDAVEEEDDDLEGVNYFGLEEENQDEDQNREEEDDEEEDDDLEGMNYFGLGEENQDEDQNREEEEDDLEDEAKQGLIKRPISTNNQSLEDMIKSSGGEPYIATIGPQEQDTTLVFKPTLEPPFSRQ